MIGAGMIGGVTAVDPAVLVLLSALRQQESGLASVASRLSAEGGRIPRAAEDGWHGAARAAYDIALGRLRATLGEAVTAVDAALRDTRVAIASLDRRIP